MTNATATRTLGTGDGSSPTSYAKLHPGPGWTREQAASHQRARIYAAMIELVAERGYGAVTVRELVRFAGVSPRTFYEHFADKDECFLRTYGLIVRRSTKQVGAAQRDCDDWRERLRLALRAWADGIVREPQAARLALVEAFAGGPAALEQMRRAEAHYEAMIQSSFAGAPDPVPVPALVIKGIVAGVHRVARAQLLAGRAHELPGLVDELLEWMLCFRCHAATSLARLDAEPARAVPRAAPPTQDRAVYGEDRARILDAVARLAAQEGYWQLTVPRIRSVAGVSRKCFDEHFEDVQGCFVAALEGLSERALANAITAGVGSHSWPGGLHRAVCSLCADIGTDPMLARLGFVEVFAPGPDGMRYRERSVAAIAESLRTSAPAGQRPSELAAEASIGAVWGVIHHHVAVGRAHELPSIAEVLSYLALAPAIGGQPAVQAIAAERGAIPDEVVAHEEEAACGLLAILADDWTWLTLCELAAEPKRQDELQQRLPPLAVSTVNVRLHRLLAAGIATERRLSARPPRVAYQLTRQGAEVRSIRQAAADWEARASPACVEESLHPGGTALRLLADEWVLPIIGCLAVGARRRGEIQLRMPGLGEATLDDRLQRLRDLGLVRYQRHRGFPVRVEYELAPAGRWLPAVALLAIRWEWRWGRPARPLLSSDLAGLVSIVAPLARIAARVSGVCELAVRSATAIEPSTVLDVRDGAIRVLPRSRQPVADARAEAHPLGWCDALVIGGSGGLEISGSAELVEEIVKGLHAVLSTDWRSV